MYATSIADETRGRRLIPASAHSLPKQQKHDYADKSHSPVYRRSGLKANRQRVKRKDGQASFRFRQR